MQVLPLAELNVTTAPFALLPEGSVNPEIVFSRIGLVILELSTLLSYVTPTDVEPGVVASRLFSVIV